MSLVGISDSCQHDCNLTFVVYGPTQAEIRSFSATPQVFLPWVLLSPQLNFAAVQGDNNEETIYGWSAWKSCCA